MHGRTNDSSYEQAEGMRVGGMDRRAYLVELVHGRRDRPDLFWRYTAYLEDAVQDFAVVHLHIILDEP